MKRLYYENNTEWITDKYFHQCLILTEDETVVMCCGGLISVSPQYMNNLLALNKIKKIKKIPKLLNKYNCMFNIKPPVS